LRMKTLKYVLWYMGIVAAIALLAASYLTHNALLTLTAVVLTVVLRQTNRFVPIPKTFARMGITNDLFQGEARHEKNHQ